MPIRLIIWLPPGLEAVIGYLYLKGDQDRLDHLLEEILEGSINERKS